MMHSLPYGSLVRHTEGYPNPSDRKVMYILEIYLGYHITEYMTNSNQNLQIIPKELTFSWNFNIYNKI